VTLNRALAAALISGLLVAGEASNATAQQPAAKAPQSANQPGWQFNVALYLWLPSIALAAERVRRHHAPEGEA
jgi:hypothetical protein